MTRARNVTRLHLVRHGQASGSWREARDPGLSDEGRRQASTVATRLAPLGPLPLVSSPMRRARETAASFEAAWSTTAIVEPRVTEIPSPIEDLAGRSAWLRDAMRSTWIAMPPLVQAWREGVVQALLDTEQDTLVVTHYVVINAATSHALADDRVVVTRPGYCSHTVLEHDGASLRVVALGDDTATEVLA